MAPPLRLIGPAMPPTDPAAVRAFARPGPDLSGTTLGADGGYLPTAPDPVLAELGGYAPAPEVLAGMPRFLVAPQAAPAPQAPASPPPSPAPSGVPFLRALETGRPVAELTREMTPRAPAEPRARAAPRIVGAPRRREIPAAPPEPQVDSMGRSLAPDFVDAMTQRQRPIWQAPQDTSYDRERRAIAAAEQIAQQRAELQARQAEDAADAEAAFAQRQAEHEAERARAEGDARGAYARSADRLAGMHLDPARYYRNAGAIGMIGNAIAVGLGALGEAFGGGPNRAVDMIAQAVDRDIAAQERDISTAAQDVDARRGILAEVRNDFTSRQAALEAARAIALREAASRAEAQAAMQGSAEAVANGTVLRDRLLTQAEAAAANAQREEALALLELRQTAANIRRAEARATQEELRARRMAGAGTGAPAPERGTAAQWAAYREARANGVAEDRSLALAGLPADLAGQLGGSPVTTEQRSALDALDASLRIVEDGITAGEASGDIAGVGIVDRSLPAMMQSDEGLRMRTAIDNTIDLLGRLRSGAAITEDEWLRFARVLEGSGTERELRIGIQQIRSELAGRLGMGGRRQSGAGAADAAIASIGGRVVTE